MPSVKYNYIINTMMSILVFRDNGRPIQESWGSNLLYTKHTRYLCVNVNFR